MSKSTPKKTPKFKETEHFTYIKHAVRFSAIEKCFKPEGFGGVMPVEAYLFGAGIAERDGEKFTFQDIRVYFKRT